MQIDTVPVPSLMTLFPLPQVTSIKSWVKGTRRVVQVNPGPFNTFSVRWFPPVTFSMFFNLTRP